MRGWLPLVKTPNTGEPLDLAGLMLKNGMCLKIMASENVINIDSRDSGLAVGPCETMDLR